MYIFSFARSCPSSFFITVLNSLLEVWTVNPFGSFWRRSISVGSEHFNIESRPSAINGEASHSYCVIIKNSCLLGNRNTLIHLEFILSHKQFNSHTRPCGMCNRIKSNISCGLSRNIQRMLYNRFQIHISLKELKIQVKNCISQNTDVTGYEQISNW